MKDILTKISELVDCKISTDSEILNEYGTDWSNEFTPNPLAVIFPRTTDEIKKIVLLANKENTALVPSGGRTGLSGGGTALNNEVIISFDKMNQILEFNEIDQTLKVQAGVTTKEVQDFAKDKNLLYPVDFGSKGSSQIGGNIATNAGGVNVIRYGSTRNWIRGIKVVTGLGDVLELNKGLIKNATGYNLMNLFIGSEGTLGFITEAVLQLSSLPKTNRVFLLSISDISKVSNILVAFRNILKLNAFEFFSENAVNHVLKNKDLSFPIKQSSPFYILIDFELESETTLEKSLETYNKLLEENLITDGILSQSDSQSKQLWRFREDITESISRHFTYKNDISVRPHQIPGFLSELEIVLRNEYPSFEVIWFGHIGDGNLHLSILKPNELNRNEFIKKCRDVSKLVYKLIERYEGSISAEHGIGVIKKNYLKHSRSKNEIDIMKKIKEIFDPNNIINPGKIF